MVADFGNLSPDFEILLLRNSLKIPGGGAATRDFSRFDEVGMVLKINDLFLG